MTNSFQSLVQAELDAVVFGDFAEDVAYTPHNGSSTTISAVVTPQIALLQAVTDGEGTTHTATLIVPSGTYQVGDQFVFRGKTWKYKGCSPTDFDGSQEITVNCYEPFERSREGYRGSR